MILLFSKPGSIRVAFRGPDETVTSINTVEEASSIMSIIGPPGASAYEVALANGFVGTEQEWLDSLQGSGTSGSGDVVGPSSAVDGHLVVFDLTSGKLVKDGGLPFSGSYNDLTGKPILFSGDYNDLTGKPTLFSGLYSDLTGKPTLFSGAYSDLTGKPTLFSGLYSDLTGKPTLGTSSSLNIDTDPTLSTASNSLLPTQGAVKAYIDQSVTSALKFMGSIDASTNPNYPVASKGHSYVISVSGKIGGASGISVDTGDMILAKVDNVGGSQGIVGSSWTLLEHNLVGALLSTNNLSDLTNVVAARTNLGIVAVAISGNYSDLTGTPTAVSAFTNDSNFITRSGISATGSLAYNSTTGVISYTAPTLASVAISGDYSDLTGAPTAVSAFTNDAGYLTSAGSSNMGAMLMLARGTITL